MKKAEIAANAGFLGFAVGAIFTAICYEADKKQREERRHQFTVDENIRNLEIDVESINRKIDKMKAEKEKEGVPEGIYPFNKNDDGKRPGKEQPRHCNKHHH